jgi:hypothetical protein
MNKSKRILDINNITSLPDEIIDIIYDFVPEYLLVFTNHEHYENYHHLLKPKINDYEEYIRCTIRNDYDFVFSKVMYENCNNWMKLTLYPNDNISFIDYNHFLLHYSMKNESSKCQSLLKELFAQLYTDIYKNKYKHKKNSVTYINGKIKYKPNSLSRRKGR